MKTILLVVVMLALLATTVAGLVVLWIRADVAIPLIGWVMIIAGGVLSVALGVGLMALSFYSSRRGFDDLQRPDDPEP